MLPSPIFTLGKHLNEAQQSRLQCSQVLQLYPTHRNHLNFCLRISEAMPWRALWCLKQKQPLMLGSPYYGARTCIMPAYP